MTSEEKIAFKANLKQAGLHIISDRIAVTKAAMDSAQEAANSDSKSSAGDKYETGRAMGHLEKDMYARQLAETMKELARLQEVKADVIYTTVQTGAFVQCEEQSFFIAAGLGKQLVDGRPVFFLSPYTPLAKLLLHKNAGDNFPFNKVSTVILDVF
ncbi:hypothetical protein [Chitinophaga eiseniae]|uniref:Transcription elongation factor, GreA/GreB, C-term n=1 Tax=Chitinophaga eiseniae TaxID=634771 RepID=A0A847SHC8_9BACT|nr:hypothetical protein [Chitinophaga eiseniae]NLR78187.1 hypothetical protein [Chitinophaga eiseniae]